MVNLACYLTVIKSNLITLVHSPDMLMKCSSCRKVAYCTKECQRKGWKEDVHKHECGVLKSSALFANSSSSAASSSHDHFRFLLRFALKFTFDKHCCTRKYALYDGKCRTLADLVTHERDNLLTDKRILPLISALRDEIAKHAGTNLDASLLFRLHSMLKINSMVMVDAAEGKQFTCTMRLQ